MTAREVRKPLREIWDEWETRSLEEMLGASGFVASIWKWIATEAEPLQVQWVLMEDLAPEIRHGITNEGG